MPPVPAGLRERVQQFPADPGMPSALEWLERLPGTAADMLQRWSLRVDGQAMHGCAALVLPVTRADGSAAVLKVVRPHLEAADERLSLRAWAGDGAVRLLAADPSRWALLLERLDHTRDLTSVDVLESCTQIGRLLHRLDRPALPWARKASEHLAELVEDIDRFRSAGRASERLPRRMLDQARALATDLAAEPGVDARLVHTDLHHENALWRPDPGEWVAIDPQTMAAEPALAVAPVLWNRWDEAVRASDVRSHLNARLEVLCEAAGVDPDRARACSIVRLVRNVLWDLAGPRPTTEGDVTQIITIVKALQPA